MYSTEKLVLPSKAQRIFQNLLLLYPEQYRKRFEDEMLLTFEDLYQEKVALDGQAGVLFWLRISFDIFATALEQQGKQMQKLGMKKYMGKTFHINKYNIIGFVLLLPFFSVFLISILARIAQGDLTHYNRPLNAFLSHSLLYWFPVLFTWVILFPALAVLLNIIPLLKALNKNHGFLFAFFFIKQNAFTLLILAVGLGFLAIIIFHDFAPCFVHGILRFGPGKLPSIVSYCRNA